MKYGIEVSPLDKPRHWRLIIPIVFEDIVVPAGFCFDGASIPWVFGLRTLLPHGGKKFFASCVHDYLYRTQTKSRKEADQVFYRALIANGVSKFQAGILYAGVRLGGWASWMKRAKPC